MVTCPHDYGCWAKLAEDALPGDKVIAVWDSKTDPNEPVKLVRSSQNGEPVTCPKPVPVGHLFHTGAFKNGVDYHGHLSLKDYYGKKQLDANVEYSVKSDQKNYVDSVTKISAKIHDNAAETIEVRTCVPTDEKVREYSHYSGYTYVSLDECLTITRQDSKSLVA